MTIGKYSPAVGKENKYYEDREFVHNAKGQRGPFVFDKGSYNQEDHFANYDHEGFDFYGYSAYDSDGKFVGVGNGVDKFGYTEDDYMCNQELYDQVYED